MPRSRIFAQLYDEITTTWHQTMGRLSRYEGICHFMFKLRYISIHFHVIRLANCPPTRGSQMNREKCGRNVFHCIPIKLRPIATSTTQFKSIFEFICAINMVFICSDPHRNLVAIDTRWISVAWLNPFKLAAIYASTFDLDSRTSHPTLIFVFIFAVGFSHSVCLDGI